MNSRDVLIETCLSSWTGFESGKLSARALSQSAGVAVSSIYHHFGNMEQLFYVAHERALHWAEQWCAERLDDLSAHTAIPRHLGPLLAGLIDDWARDQRKAAIAWHECRLSASRNEIYRPLAARWQRLWEEFWSNLCARIEESVAVTAVSRFFEGESSFHLLEWRRLLDRAALAESCAGWQAWMEGRLAPASPWRDHARAEAQKILPPLADRDPIVRRLSEAAADLISRNGPSGLTHRALADAANLSLGSVSNKLRSRSDLMNAAFEALYQRMAPDGVDIWVRPPSMDRADMIAAIAWGTVGDMEKLRGHDELLMACVRDQGLRPFGAQLRYMRGRSSQYVLPGLVGRPASETDAALFSSFMVGVKNFHMAEPSSPIRTAGVESDVLDLIKILNDN
ncbi:TetR family transcriptional regulator [Sphingobium sp.]|uniref:TetR family transcriptional regulator n=1 Tax=Sphingobium sp. TaxID=1912891 RepID=UPI002C749EB2|nr:TetR family transcriptional regulator [Sphingobium sp.]HUD94090.1 TetR family transcriptional regulator [Sphingobium sp.]